MTASKLADLVEQYNNAGGIAVLTIAKDCSTVYVYDQMASPTVFSEPPPCSKLVATMQELLNEKTGLSL